MVDKSTTSKAVPTSQASRAEESSGSTERSPLRRRRSFEKGPRRSGGRSEGKSTRNRSLRGKSRRPRKRVIMLVNSQAKRFNSNEANNFANQLTAAGHEVTILRPESSSDMAKQASEAAQKRPLALVAVGGDGAVNLVARAVIGTDVRLAVLPQGKCNDFFTSLIGKPSYARAVEAFKSGAVRSIDCGVVSGQPFFTSVGLGLLPALSEALSGRSLPRFGIGWSRLTTRVSETLERQKTPVRIDAYRFDLEPQMITVSILPYCLGLKLSPTALSDDRRLEITLDMNEDDSQPSKFIRSVYKQDYSFEGSYRLYRGEEVIIGSTKGRKLYLDGELIETPTNLLEISIQTDQIQVCLLNNES